VKEGGGVWEELEETLGFVRAVLAVLHADLQVSAANLREAEGNLLESEGKLRRTAGDLREIARNLQCADGGAESGVRVRDGLSPEVRTGTNSREQ
jgi:hypothetical protein